MSGYESIGIAYLRHINCMFFNKKFQDLTSFPGHFRSEGVSDSHHIPSHTTPYLLYIFKVLVATQLTRQNSYVFLTISNHTSAATLRISHRLRYVSVLTCLEGTNMLSSLLSLPIPISTTGKPDRQTGREL